MLTHARDRSRNASSSTLGTYTAPIYEIYKVGQAPFWLNGLDVLSPLGFRTAVLPHFDNQEGGDHDTRFCYLGQRRFEELESQIDPEVVIIGVDEHTMAVIDGAACTLRATGRGGVTLRQRGVTTRVEGSTVLDLSAFRTVPRSEERSPASAPPHSPDTDTRVGNLRVGLDAADIDMVVEALLQLQADGSDAATAALRSGVIGLGDLARAGTGGTTAVVPLVEAILDLRGQARRDQHFALADQLRDVLVAAGVDIRDTPAGAVWERIG